MYKGQKQMLGLGPGPPSSPIVVVRRECDGSTAPLFLGSATRLKAFQDSSSQTLQKTTDWMNEMAPQLSSAVLNAFDFRSLVDGLTG